MAREKFKMIPLTQLLALSKDKINEKLAPSRAKHIRKKIELEMANLEMTLDEKRQQIQESYAKDKELNVIHLKDLVQEISLIELDINTYEDIISQLFPEEEESK